MIAHIGNIPVEEWLPFVVPVLVLGLYGHRKERKRREAVRRLAEPSEALDGATVELVMARWAKAGRAGLRSEHIPILYPPGPDGMTVDELAQRAHADPGAVERLLDELEDLGYAELELLDEDPRAWLTVEGCALQYETEAVLLSQAPSWEDRARPRGAIRRPDA